MDRFITDIKTRSNGKKDRQYYIWRSIANRCYNKNDKAYKYYGARGVTVCEEWYKYSNFKKWHDDNYIEWYHIDKDISGKNIYSPSTCVFVKKKKKIQEKW